MEVVGLDKLLSKLEDSKKEVLEAQNNLHKLSGNDGPGSLDYNNRKISNYNNEATGGRNVREPFPGRTTAGISEYKRQNENYQPSGGDAKRMRRSPMRRVIHNDNPNIPRSLITSRITVVHSDSNHNKEEDKSLSSVVRVAKQPSRTEKVRQMGGIENKHSTEDMERGRRMMNLMLGHLQAARVESEQQRKSSTAQKRKEVEKRIDEQEMERQEEYRRERTDLFKAKRAALQRTRQLETKCRAVEAFTRWAEEIRKMQTHVRTKHSPFIFYRPKVWDDSSRQKLEETKSLLEACIAERRARLEEEIEHTLNEVGAPAGGGEEGDHSVANNAANLSTSYDDGGSMHDDHKQQLDDSEKEDGEDDTIHDRQDSDNGEFEEDFKETLRNYVAPAKRTNALAASSPPRQRSPSPVRESDDKNGVSADE